MEGSVLGTSVYSLSLGNTTTLLTQIITGSFVTGGGTDGTVMEKMDVDDDAVVDLSVKYVHWFFPPSVARCAPPHCC
jgi:hypothetical protein